MSFWWQNPQFDIEAGMKELKLRQRQLTEINGRIDEKQEETDAVELQQNRLNHERRILEGRRTGWEEQLAGHERAIRNATRHVEEVESGHKRIASEITALQSEIEGVRRKVFDEVFGFIDERNAALNRGIRVGKEDIQAAACAIDTLQATIRELDEAASPDLIQSLKDTLRETRGKSNEAAGRKTAVDARVRALEIQRERFVQFKTYLANTKIEALSRITNEFLQDIGSDIRIRFDGYTVLKSGKVRRKSPSHCCATAWTAARSASFRQAKPPCEFGDHPCHAETREQQLRRGQGTGSARAGRDTRGGR